MKQCDYFISELYPQNIRVRDVVDFLKSQISQEKEISFSDLLQCNDISEKEISLVELGNFLNQKKLLDMKREFLLENFNVIIKEQWARDKKNNHYSRRNFLDIYFKEKAPVSEDTLTKWCNNEPKKDSQKLKLLFAFEEMSVASEMFNDYFSNDSLERIPKDLSKDSKGDSLEVAVLSDMYKLTDFLLPSLKRLDYSVRRDIEYQINREVKKSLGTSLNQNSYKKQMTIIKRILKKFLDNNSRLSRSQFEAFLGALKSENYFFSLNYPSETELIDEFLNIAKEESLDVDRDDINLNLYASIEEPAYIIRKNKSKGLKNHRLYFKSSNGTRKYIQTKLHEKKVFKDKKFVLDGKGKKKVFKGVLQKIKENVIYDVVSNKKQSNCLNLVYKSNREICILYRQLPKFSNNKIKKGRGILRNRKAIVDVEYNQWFYMINYFINYRLNANVTIKDRTIKIKFKSLSKHQKEYNHFYILKNDYIQEKTNKRNLFSVIKEANFFADIPPVINEK